MATKRYGFRVFVGSCIFSAVTIGISLFLFFSLNIISILALVLYDEHRQKTRRQVSVQYRLNSIQQKENMNEYELQRQKYDEYKAAHS